MEKGDFGVKLTGAAMPGGQFGQGRNCSFLGPQSSSSTRQQVSRREKPVAGCREASCQMLGPRGSSNTSQQVLPVEGRCREAEFSCWDHEAVVTPVLENAKDVVLSK
jgi:hypothetical protein